MVKKALLLSGGGARGAFQVGAVSELVKAHDFEIFSGISVGAINAAFLAQAAKGKLAEQSDSLLDLWTNKIREPGDVYEPASDWPGLLENKDSLFETAPLKRMIRQSIDAGALRASGRVFTCGMVSLVSGEYLERDQNAADIIDAIIASTAIPPVFPPVWLGERNAGQDVLVDGGCRDVTPLRRILRLAPDEIYVILTSRLLRKPGRTGVEAIPENGTTPDKAYTWQDDTTGTKVNGKEILVRSLGILLDEVYLADIREALFRHEVAKLVAQLNGNVPDSARSIYSSLERNLVSRDGRIRCPEIFVLAPRLWFDQASEDDDIPEPANDPLEFTHERITNFIRHGKEIAADPGKWLYP